MRSFSNFTIFLLCLSILVIDILAFYWLQSITQLINMPKLRLMIHLAFWFFTIGLITAIVILKIRLDNIHPQRKHLLITSLYGLTVSSFIPKIIFVIIISFLYFSNYMLSEKESLIVIPVIGLLAGFLPFFVIIYAIFKALYRFKVHHLHLKTELLPDSHEPLRVVQISDLHLGSFNFRYHILERAVKIINHLEPDLIVFTGDLVNNFAWELKGWSEILDKLKAKKGKFAVLGNHDYGDYSSWDTPELKMSNFESIKYFYKKIGFNLLLNESVVIKNEKAEIAVLGVENWGVPPFKQYGDLEKSLENVRSIPFKILLSHDPTHWPEEVVADTDIYLTLSGHTHGMQAGVKLKNKQWSPIKYKYKHWAGLHKEGDQYLNVNRGLGWLGFPGRLGMRPEITCIDIKTQPHA
ncbi:metallophosphoesterase [Lutimonas zeaxanthinifaciens]|uniref:metallophosphoesterase n=1 Tax=Lutimonas zeaxanthinifaciens TaxID=3060215 RepID=UPI00265CB430|nr:metallophosphoesterase [Lutimonas sp. YSD2104]WKK64892.1 metallophosphoesterase [Lutimonas sp. YSD2104]